jgi:hypothetical protein
VKRTRMLIFAPLVVDPAQASPVLRPEFVHDLDVGSARGPA